MDRKKQKIESGTGWERENRRHFDEIVLNYDKSRWDYPNELFDDVLAYCGQGSSKNAIEIGAVREKQQLRFLMQAIM